MSPSPTNHSTPSPKRTPSERPSSPRPASVPDLLSRLQRDGLSVRRTAGTIGTREYVIDLGTSTTD